MLREELDATEVVRERGEGEGDPLKGEVLIARSIVSKWLKEVMLNEYTLTVHPRDREIPEKEIRALKDAGWSLNFKDDKLIIRSNDPVSLAKLHIKLSNRGYIVESD